MIEVKDLTFYYGKNKQALHGLDFTVEDGEIFGFLGPNGSGKSTTQKILTGILKGHGGKVSLFGQDISAAHTQEFFQKIGVLFEFPYLYANLSAVDNLKYFSSFYWNLSRTFLKSRFRPTQRVCGRGQAWRGH